MILLDTYSFIGLVAQQNLLSKTAAKTITKNAGSIFVSAISAYELALDYHKRLIELPLTPFDWFQKALELHGLIELPITGEIGVKAAQLPQIHENLFDRMLVSSAICHKMALLTPNRFIKSYPDTMVIW
ncbi:MAG: type II toxin-antitoxin system VapC family toxin [Gammaproteobacteria bacterium]|nr:type II toxin-antitoxin system VapC family toxin [Gammaproteobacteria bacterium]